MAPKTKMQPKIKTKSKQVGREGESEEKTPRLIIKSKALESRLNLGKYDPIKKEFTASKIYNHYKSIYVDLSWNRYGGVERLSGWTFQVSRDYLLSLVEGNTHNRIILVDIETALKRAREKSDKASEAYFEDLWLRGFKYVTIDGNNTASTIYHFVSNHPEMYLLHDGIRVSFKDLHTTDQQNFLEDVVVDCTILRDISVDQMSEVFKKQNTASALTRHELRNAIKSPVSKYCRDVANDPKTYKAFTPLLIKSEKHRHQRKHEEELARALMSRAIPNTSATPAGLDELFEEGYLNKEAAESIKKALTVMDSLEYPPIGKPLKAGKWHTLLELIQITHDKNYKISDIPEFRDWFFDWDNKEHAKSLKMPAEKEKDAYYYWQKIHWDSKNRKKRKKHIDQMLAQDCEDLLKKGVLTKKRTKKDAFPQQLVSQLYELQGGKDRYGNDISLIDVHAGAYHMDHVDSVKNGGQTTLDNAELMRKEDNLAKGSKSNQPHFDHQK